MNCFVTVFMDKPHVVQLSKLIVNSLPQTKQLTIYTRAVHSGEGVGSCACITKQLSYLFHYVHLLCSINVLTCFFCYFDSRNEI